MDWIHTEADTQKATRCYWDSTFDLETLDRIDFYLYGLLKEFKSNHRLQHMRNARGACHPCIPYMTGVHLRAAHPES